MLCFLRLRQRLPRARPLQKLTLGPRADRRLPRCRARRWCQTPPIQRPKSRPSRQRVPTDGMYTAAPNAMPIGSRFRFICRTFSPAGPLVARPLVWLVALELESREGRHHDHHSGRMRSRTANRPCKVPCCCSPARPSLRPTAERLHAAAGDCCRAQIPRNRGARHLAQRDGHLWCTKCCAPRSATGRMSVFPPLDLGAIFSVVSVQAPQCKGARRGT
ncbi:hypothetical protein ACVWZK_000064 [Bradyrhizobium sp. GM0.4]